MKPKTYKTNKPKDKSIRFKIKPSSVRNYLHFASQRDIPSVTFTDKSKVIPRKQKYKDHYDKDL